MYKQSFQKTIVKNDQELHARSDEMAPWYIWTEISSHFTLPPGQTLIDRTFEIIT